MRAHPFVLSQASRVPSRRSVTAQLNSMTETFTCRSYALLISLFASICSSLTPLNLRFSTSFTIAFRFASQLFAYFAVLGVHFDQNSPTVKILQQISPSAPRKYLQENARCMCPMKQLVGLSCLEKLEGLERHHSFSSIQAMTMLSCRHPTQGDKKAMPALSGPLLRTSP